MTIQGQTESPIERWVRERRRSLNGQAEAPTSYPLQDDAPLWGLALSGGGIRSATFCLGLIKALATRKTFLRFDLLSTVSGGGYTGGAIGRLFNEETLPHGARTVEAHLADLEHTAFGAWLRANGRYLTPQGIRDTLFATASFLRSLMAVHLELGVLCLALACLVVGIDLLAWQHAHGQYAMSHGRMTGCPSTLLGVMSGWPVLWALLPAIAVSGLTTMFGYWALGEAPSAREGSWLRTVLGLAMLIGGSSLVVATVSTRHGWTDSDPLPISFCVIGSILLIGGIGQLLSVVAAAGTTPGEALGKTRNRLTRWLSTHLTATLLVLAIGAIDWVAFALADASTTLQGYGIVTAIAGVLVRALLPSLGDFQKVIGETGRSVSYVLLAIAGWATSFVMAVLWFGVAHAITWSYVFRASPSIGPSSDAVLDLDAGWVALGCLFVPVFLWIVVTGFHADFVNRASMWTFYRARLARAYLGASNPKRVGKAFDTRRAAGVGRTLASLTGDTAVEIPDVGTFSEHDDVSMVDYAPHRAGAPVHLLNVCVNQTTASVGRLFNRDRKGLPLVVGPEGSMRAAGSPWKPGASDAPTLAGWQAISGAAVSPGLGASNRPGLSALLTLAGVRLGYWLPSNEDGQSARWFPKYGRLLAELSGRFRGSERGDRFLSDGGHYENTGALTLIEARCAVIVVADCGADPRYQFRDLENLVRHARIDHGAEITFLRPDTRRRRSRTRFFGTPSEIADPASRACLALARITYRDGSPDAHMIVVKPAMSDDLPLDLQCYADESRLFPQEPTTDQWFSEAQWESYFSLGNTIGQRLPFDHLNTLADFAATNFVAIAPRSDDKHASGSVAAAVVRRRYGGRASKPLTARRRPASALP